MIYALVLAVFLTGCSIKNGVVLKCSGPCDFSMERDGTLDDGQKKEKK